MPAQPTLLDFALIDKHVDKFAGEYGLKRHLALQALVLHYYLGLDQIQIENSITDGSRDCGIDGIYIDDNPERSTIYIYQAKLIEGRGKLESAFPGSAIDKLCHAIDNYILKPAPDKLPSYINSALAEKIKDVRVALDEYPRIELLFLSNGLPANPEAQSKLNAWLDQKNKHGTVFGCKFISSNELVAMIAPDQTEVIDADIRLTGEYAEWSGKQGVRTVIGKVAAERLAKLREDKGLQLFEKNIRPYLGQSNSRQINQNILRSAFGEQAAHFFLLNNGVTIVCKKMKYTPVDESPNLILTDLQIVNGGQTTNSIHEAYLQKRDIKKAYVLVKFIETEDEQLLSEITEATNSQTPVTARDLKSNDPTQRKIEEQLKLKGFFYEARLEKYKKEAIKSKRIDAPVAAQAIFAYEFGKPVEAKNQKRLLFTDFYDEIFDPSNYELAEQILNAWLLYQRIHTLRKEFQEKFTFYSHAELTILALLKFAGVTSEWDDASLALMLSKMLTGIQHMVDEEAKMLGEKYSHRQLFISKDTIMRLRTVLKI